MAISFPRYIDITSSVGGATLVANRDLILRIFTDNTKLPPGSIIEFTSAAQVIAYFGTSPEGNVATFYFSRISKSGTAPQKISYSRWVDTAVAPMIFGAKIPENLLGFQSISNGSFGLSIGGVSQQIAALDFTAVTSFADVAAVLQAGIRAQSGTQWTAATVTYSNTTNSFNFVGGDNSVAAVITTSIGTTGTNILSDIGWGVGAILCNGALVETITQTLTNSSQLSNNFASFYFLAVTDIDQSVEAATWNQTQNVSYMFLVASTISTYAALSAALFTIGGTAVVNEVSINTVQCPAMILASIDYNSRNAVQNYMYQQFPGLAASVMDDTTADALDTARVNYYGVTQTAGQQIAFFQRGVMMGGATDPLDMGIYGNEIWLRDAAGVAIMNLLLALGQLSVDDNGRAQFLAIMQSVINQALFNGVISVGKPLTDIQKVYVSEISGDPNAWYQVQSIGYWLDCTTNSFLNINSILEYELVYTLIYSKNDSVNKVIGRHILI